ncbi:MAG: NUDIX hydrolase [Firmicutes bacterium]|nr:NUDIX hydrolase [Bacillota bacterium]MBQ1888327.1 NUDIX hydrolase [Bacillota bacterium]MBQ4233449.1 NUDIX hydrolase [Bacillota bacterium]MBQ5437292.1 NUDIX hydrolase [Bacillota bacterium]
MIPVEKTIKKETVLKNPIFTLVKHTVVTGSGAEKSRYIVEHKGAAAIAAVTGEGKLLMVRQYRKAVDQIVWEIPAGKIDPDEEPEEFIGKNGRKGLWRSVAERELREETGWKGVNWEPLCCICGSVGYCSEKIEIWRCDCESRGSTDFDEDEYLELYEMEIPKLVEMIGTGEIFDAKTIAAVLMLDRERKDAR